MPRWKDRRRAQSGTTLVELLVALVIASLALALVIGTLSTGLLDATLAKRNAAIQAVMQYETDQVHAAAFSGTAAAYSDCFATEDPAATPASADAFQAACPSGSYTLRADVSWAWQGSSTTVQLWTIAVNSWPASPQALKSIQVFKVAHR